MSEEKQSKVTYDDEIDLVELAKHIWSRRKFIAKFTGIFVLVGLFVAFTSKDEYTSTCKLLPETQEGGLGNLGTLGGLAGLAGIDLSSMSGSAGGLSPSLYPELVSSKPFMYSLINEPIRFESLDTTMSSFIYFKEVYSPGLLGLLFEYTVGLPGKIKSKLNATKPEVSEATDGEYVRLSKEQAKIIEKTIDRIEIGTNPENGVISVEVEMPDPYAAAVLANMVVDKLTNEVIRYKIEKAQISMEFIQERYREAERLYGLKQQKLAIYSDRNRNVTSSLVQIEQNRLENEVDIAFEVFKGLASQLEQAKIKVKEETPVFTILEPVDIPSEKSNIRLSILMIVMLFGGFTLSALWVLIVSFLDNE
ncbi:Wzz/FepE/Etk N-terminal domain-containing protein [Marinoscillum sp. MHG1-6]|uniref:Wzz/FepE/Etk N-terminal domain-containing protein n=1 Tax=Marinoscillum sp. MHG1-6 TaxID=2959627 RepID=UPI002157D3CA|nr:Wzz/FepE/Etk N-terminal domain-containing protein [Marinoscillum sp. MHG1-6]